MLADDGQQAVRVSVEHMSSSGSEKPTRKVGESWKESTRSGGLAAGRGVDVKKFTGFTVESSN